MVKKLLGLHVKKKDNMTDVLVRLIDVMASDMGSSVLREELRKYGYDIDADTDMLRRRGINVE